MNPSSEGETIHFDVLINGVQTKVKVNKDILETRDIRINVFDMIGLKKSAQKKEEHSYTLYYYPKLKKWLKQPQRYLQSLDFTVLDTDQWIDIEDRLISLIYNRPIGTSLKLLIFFNPTSGSNSKSHLSRILNFLNYTNMEPYIINTTHRNHCLEYLRNYNKASNGDNEYCGIAIVSGDGLMHEYVNSLCRIPVTHVPAGSGNAFARTQMFWAQELCKDEESIFLVIKNRLRKFSLAKYELEKIEQPVYSFLSLQWAMFADLDINSEFLRCLGILRFEVYAAWLLLRHKSYLGKLSYSTIQQKIPNFGTDLDKNPNYHSLRTNFAHTIFCMIPFISEKHKIAPVLSNPGEDPFIDMQVLEHQSGRYQLLKYLLSSESGSHFDLQEERPTDGYAFMHRKVKSFRLEPLDGNEPGVFCIDGEMYESQKLQASLPGDKYFMAFC